MADERIVIEIKDKIDSSIITKLRWMMELAKSASSSIDQLRKSLNMIKSSLPQSVASELGKISKQASEANANALKLKGTLSSLKVPKLRMPTPLPGPTPTPSPGAGMGSAAKNMIGAYAGYQGIKEVIELTSAYTGLQNKLRNVTDTEAQLARISDEVFTIANKSRVPVEETAKAFQRFDLALKLLGAGQGESLRMTETVNKMLILSGASTGEAASGLLQLSQAFNKGKLDGDEFRSVMELMPPVADAIAKQLGVTRGELLKLAPEGKITAEVMRQALASVATTTDEKFAKMVPTVGQSMTVLKNTLIKEVGEMNKELELIGPGLIQSLTKAIPQIMPEIKMLITSIRDWLNAAFGMGASGEGVMTFFKRLLQGISFLFAGLADVISGLHALFTNLVVTILNSISSITGAMGTAGKMFAGFDGPLGWIGKALSGESMQGITNWTKKLADDMYNGLMKDAGPTAIEKWMTALEQSEFGGPAKVTGELRPAGKSLQAAASGEDMTPKGRLNRYRKPVRAFSSDLFEKPDYSGLKDRTGQDITNSILLGLGFERMALRKNNEEREIEAKYQEIKKEWYDKDIKMSQTQLDLIKQRITANLEEARIAQARNSIIDSTVGARTQFQNQAMGLKQAQGTPGFTNADTNATLMQQSPQIFEGTSIQFQNMQDQWKQYYAQIDVYRKANVISEKQAKEAERALDRKQMNDKLTNAQSMFGNLASLQNTKNKELWQIGKAAAIAEATISGYVAVQRALAGPPGPPWSYAIAASAGVLAAVNVANIASTPAPFEKGGLVNGGEQLIRINERGQEFVMNAQATAANRPALEAMNKGRSVGTGVQVTIQNFGTSKDFEVQQVSPEEVRIIARDEIRNQVPGLVANEISNPNSRVSKSLGQNTQADRRR
jgi:tape measure domain-containing protein